jgi:hypothetical protein
MITDTVTIRKATLRDVDTSFHVYHYVLDR